MRYKLHVRVNPDTDSVVRLRQVRLRDRIARRIFGKNNRYAVLIPGGSVDEVTIIENDADDLMTLADALKAGGSQ